MTDLALILSMLDADEIDRVHVDALVAEIRALREVAAAARAFCDYEHDRRGTNEANRQVRRALAKVPT